MAWGNSVHAQTFTQEAQGYNVFVEEDFIFGGGDVEGAVAVGNNLTIQQNSGQFAIHSAGSFTVPGMSAPAGLVVGNQVTLTSGGVRILSGGKVSVGSTSGIQAISQENGSNANTRIVGNAGSYSSTPNISLDHHQSEAVFRTSPIDFSVAFAAFRMRAVNVSNMSTNMAISNANGNALNPASLSNNSQVYINQLSNGANILNLTSPNLNKISSITFNVQPSASQYLIINVSANGTFNWDNFNFTGVGSTQAQYILINFYQATRVNINRASTVYASVFAPNAEVNKNNSANIDGQVIAKSFEMTQSGEVHQMYFLPDDPTATFPVEWLAFEAEERLGNGVLSWATASEMGSSHFVVERSIDQFAYETLGTVEAEGTSQSIATYSFEDHRLHAVKVPVVFYRLRQVDLNGEFSYSKVVELRVSSWEELQLGLAPNPATSYVAANWTGLDQEWRVTLLNTLGQTIEKYNVDKALRSKTLDVSALKPGMYFVVLEGNDSRITQRMIVQ